MIKTKKQFTWIEQPALLLLCFTLLVLFIRLFLHHHLLELDEAEQVVMAQQFLPGYPDQPPLYTWLQYGFFKLFGLHLMSLVLLKSLLLFGCFYCFHHICRAHCQSIHLAWCATLAWALIPAISLDLIKDNTHSVLALLAANLTWYWLIMPSRWNTTNQYLLLGCIIGIGFLSKFNYLLFLFIFFMSALSLPTYRHKLFHTGMLFAGLLAFLIALPYLLWLLQHPSLGLHSTYKLSPSHQQSWHGLSQLMKGYLLIITPNIVLGRLIFPLKQWPLRTALTNRLVIRYHMISVPFLILVVLVFGMRDFETRWLIPILFLSPLIYFGQIQPSANAKKEKSRVSFFLLLCLLVQSVMLSGILYRSYHKSKAYKHFSFSEILDVVKQEQQQTDYLISDSHWFLGNLMLALSFHHGWLLHPANLTQLPKGHSLLIWQDNQPIWVDYFVSLKLIKEIKTIQNRQTHHIIAHYAYVTL